MLIESGRRSDKDYVRSVLRVFTRVFERKDSGSRMPKHGYPVNA